MVTILGLLAAAGYGAADFFGGAATRRNTVFNTLFLSTPIGLTLLLIGALWVGGTPSATVLAWGLASGLAGGAGMITFYRALARGPMSVVAPVSALAAAILPVLVGTARGERLNATSLPRPERLRKIQQLGMAVAVAGIALVTAG